jgi:AraC-like DNA-binding protein
VEFDRLRVGMEQYTRPDKSTILECVDAAGFGSYAQFYKVFRQHYGEGPCEFLASEPAVKTPESGG